MSNYEVVIINSPLFRDGYVADSENEISPLGLGYIATYLRDHGHSVILIDAISEDLPLTRIIEAVNRYSPRFVGINIFSTNCGIVRDIIKSLRGNVHVIIGGIATRALVEYIFMWDVENNIDIVYGDGEFITEAIVSGTLDQLPHRSLSKKRYFEVDKRSSYFVHDISSVQLDRNIFRNRTILNCYGMPEVSIITSRGCIYNCSFCSAARSLNKLSPVRVRSLDSIMSELRAIADEDPKVKSIRILDDLFIGDKDSLMEACKIFNNFSFSWRSMAHVRAFINADDENMIALRNSGCIELFIGFESGSDRILRKIKKDRRSINTVTTIRKLFRAGVNVKGYFVVGFPQEEESDIVQTYQLARTLKDEANKFGASFRISVFKFHPYFGTIIYEEIIAAHRNREKLIEPDKELTSLIGRRQVKFVADNYSKCTDEMLSEYIRLLSVLQ